MKLPHSLTRHDPEVRRAQSVVNTLELEINQLHSFSIPSETMIRAQKIQQLRRELTIARQKLELKRIRASDRIIMMNGGSFGK